MHQTAKTIDRPWAIMQQAGVELSPRAELPDHLIVLPGNSWALWKCVGLRGAGFPESEVLGLSAPACAGVANHALRMEQEKNRTLGQALKAVSDALDKLRSEQAWDDKARRDPLLKSIKLLRAGKLPGPINDSSTANDAIEAYRVAQAESDAALREFRQEFKKGVIHISQAIRRIALTDRFQEAIIWQNRQAFSTGVDALLRKSPEALRGSKQRQYEELIANYVQRYCVKNDTIGFFGPVGWASIVSEGQAIVSEPGSDLLATRKVYFEGWCMDVLAEKIGDKVEFRRWAAPRLMPFVRLEGAMLYLPSSPPSRLNTKQAALLKECDGKRTAKAIAVRLECDPSTGIDVEEEVYQLLKEFTDMGLMSWGFDLSIDTFPENCLRQLLERVGDDDLRAQALAALRELEQKREAVANSAGDAQRLNKAIEELEVSFTRLTGAASTRAAGQTYAARTLVFEDCRRDVRVEIGPELLEELALPMGLLLTSARWITYQMANVYRKAFKDLYADIARDSGTPIVDAVTFWVRAHPLLFSETGRPVDTIERNLQERWTKVLSATPGQRRIDYKAEELKPRVLAAFRAPRAGWQFGRYHSPDVMIAASGPEAIRRGDYLLVMGELHCAVNTLGAALFIHQHPTPEDHFRAVELDMGKPRLVPASPKSWPNATLRTRQILQSPRDIRITLGHDSIPEPGTDAIPISEMVVEDRNGALVFRTRDGRISFDLIEAMGDILSGLSINSLKLLAPDKHTPRVAFDRLVVCRETWRFSPSEVEFAWTKDEADRFLSARRWANEHGMPRFMFVKVPVEKKPFYLDFDSPIYVDIFAKMVRRSEGNCPPDKFVTMSEMLPAIGESWLPDAGGQRYTSELRIVALDLSP